MAGFGRKQPVELGQAWPFERQLLVRANVLAPHVWSVPSFSVTGNNQSVIGFLLKDEPARLSKTGGESNLAPGGAIAITLE